MSNNTGTYSVKDLLNHVLNGDETKLAVEVTGITLTSGSTFQIKNSNGFVVAEITENGDLKIAGQVIQL